jgi:hypothetical protein
MHACLGIEALGLCNYNPAAPTSIYLSIGEAVSALGFILAVQQLLKPIYSFRLRARFGSLQLLYGLMLIGASCSFIAAILPSIPALQQRGPFSYPLIWEIIAGLFFVAAYLAIIVAIIWPVLADAKSISRFAQAAARLLSAANDKDCIDFIQDLHRSLPVIIRESKFIESLRKPSAFVEFSHRLKIEQSSYASSFLHILSDEKLCKILIEKAPWQTAAILRDLSDKELHSRAAEPFIQGLARQAVVSDESMFERETGYTGFASAPVLSESLFDLPFIVTRYDPLAGLRFNTENKFEEKGLKRFNNAAKRCLTSVIESGEIYDARTAWSVRHHYEGIFRSLYQVREIKPVDHMFMIRIQDAVEEAVSLAEKIQEGFSASEWDYAFVTSADDRRSDMLQDLVEIVIEAFNGIANEFNGYRDPFWIMALQSFGACFEKYSDQIGLTPFQQRLAFKIVDKLNDNMNGYYPAISRVMLSCIGLYVAKTDDKPTPSNIIRDLVYRQMQKLPILAQTQPYKIEHYLPNNMRYSNRTTELTFTYGDGRTKGIVLSLLNVPARDLADPAIRRAHQARTS